MSRDTAAAPPTFAALRGAAAALLRKAEAIAGPPAPTAQEWQAAFALARAALPERRAEHAAVAAFGLRELSSRSLDLSPGVAALARALAATMVELHAAGQPGAAAALASLALEMAGEPGLTGLMPFFVCLEALVRARLAHDAGGAGPHSVAACWRVALDQSTAAAGPRLVLCAGLTGSGKSFVGTGLAAALGAEIAGSDRLRKQLAGVEATARTPAERNNAVYSTDMTDRVYRRLLGHATTALAAGLPVVLDATFLTPARRAPPLRLAQEFGAPAAIVWCELPHGEAAVRLRDRASNVWNVSDGDARVRALQRGGVQRPAGRELDAALLPVDANAPPSVLFDRLLPRLRAALVGR